MAYNERVEYQLDDKEDFLQDAPSKASRTQFTPGVASSKPLDMNWPIEFPVKVGIAAADSAGLRHDRVILTGRASVCDQTMLPDVDPRHRRVDAERNSGFESIKD